MVVSRPKNGVAFFSGVKRFGKITLHPGIDPSGLYTERPDGCDPCRYNPQPIHEIYVVNKNRTDTKDPWQYKQELEDWSKNLGYRNENILRNRRWQRSLLGPAWHEVKEPPKYEPACKNVGFGRTPRAKTITSDVPGPGTYYNPEPYRVPYGPHSSVPSFEYGELCRFKSTDVKWSLAPNRYKIIDKESIEQKPKRVVSLRGPYDLFSGSRDGPIYNHFNRSGRVSAATWPLALKSSIDRFKGNPYGRMNSSSRNVPYHGRLAVVDPSMCIRRPEDPGPVSYSLDQPKELKQNIHGFNSSNTKGIGYRKAIVWPGVGRYVLKDLRCGIPGHGHRHVFLCKIPRTMGSYLPQPMNTF